jgi:competence protein
VCGEIINASESFCDGCYEKINRYSGSFNLENAKSFTAAFVYDENITPAINLLKNGTCGNADFALGNELAKRLKENGTAGLIDIIVPVPMFRSDKRARGYNQSELIAKTVGRVLNIPVSSRAVIKVRKTAPQKNLNRIMRAINIMKAFYVAEPKTLSGKSVLIIDDICTTGNTLKEIAKLLIKSGVKEVHCASCCKTPPSKRKKYNGNLKK